jgi:hypothetical protein
VCKRLHMSLARRAELVGSEPLGPAGLCAFRNGFRLVTPAGSGMTWADAVQDFVQVAPEVEDLATTPCR